MKTFSFLKLDSTSIKAKDLYAQGQRLPFVVCAAEQTKGRGRRGHPWQSPPGNLYATFALECPEFKPSQIGLIPLKAAVCCALVIAQDLGLRITIKWPNDLLFAGKKIGGILCESSIEGDEIGAVFIGMGINTKALPDIDDDGNLAGSISEFSSKSFAEEQFFSAFWQHWQSLAIADIEPKFKEFATGAGQPWIERPAIEDGKSQEPSFWREVGISSDGELLLQNPRIEKKELKLAASDHLCSWAYAGKGRSQWPILVADCGNSKIKLAAFEPSISPKPTFFQAFFSDTESKALSDALEYLKSKASFFGWPLFIASVNPDATLILAAQAKAKGFFPLSLAKRRVYSYGNRYDRKMLGIDRLAALEAALSYRPKCWQLVVMFGTATTIDAVSCDGFHAGGWILPGIRSGLSSLHQMTKLLPDLKSVDLRTARLELGHDTPSAMLFGMIEMTLGAIERAKKALSAEFKVADQEIKIVITGGDAEAVHAFLPEALLVPSLVVEGLRVMALGGV